MERTWIVRFNNGGVSVITDLATASSIEKMLDVDESITEVVDIKKVTGNLVEKVTHQALAELPQIINMEERQEALENYINKMTNVELLELIDRAYQE